MKNYKFNVKPDIINNKHNLIIQNKVNKPIEEQSFYHAYCETNVTIIPLTYDNISHQSKWKSKREPFQWKRVVQKKQKFVTKKQHQTTNFNVFIRPNWHVRKIRWKSETRKFQLCNSNGWLRLKLTKTYSTESIYNCMAKTCYSHLLNAHYIW